MIYVYGDVTGDKLPTQYTFYGRMWMTVEFTHKPDFVFYVCILVYTILMV